jgi:hypothetical protein
VIAQLGSSGDGPSLGLPGRSSCHMTGTNGTREATMDDVGAQDLMNASRSALN